MKNTSKIGLITIILITLSIGIGAFTFKTISAISNRFDENYILISAIAGIVAFIIAIASNLVAFFITYFCDQKYMNEKQCEAFDIIKKIERYTKKESIVLESNDRNSLCGRGFFDTIYNNASDIRISGIKLTPLIDYICKGKKEGENWVEKLRNREHVTVKILMSSPQSTIIPALEIQEGLAPTTIVNKIKDSLNKLSDFSKSNKSRLANGSSISIRITNVIQHFNITYAGNKPARKPTDKLLLGLLFNSDNGPIYEILRETDVNTYDECLLLFDNLFRNGIEIFHWDENGITYTERKEI